VRKAVMPELTRKRAPGQPDCWHIHYDGVRVGVIARRSGNPRDTEAWRWDCGFYPGPAQPQLGGSAANFEAARRDFETAWRSYLQNCSPSDFQKHRDWIAHRAAIDAAHARGDKLPTEFPSSMMTCICGNRFDNHKPAENQIHLPHIYAAQAEGIRW
jgi:hypothetical protein